MKKLLLVGFCFLLFACSQIDSMHEFDDRQAASLAKQIYRVKPAYPVANPTPAAVKQK